MIDGPAALAPPESVRNGDTQIPPTDLLDLNLHLNKIPG